MEPHPPDLGGDDGVLSECLDGMLERRKRVAVNSRARWPVNQFIELVILAAVGEFGPSLLPLLAQGLTQLRNFVGNSPLHPSNA